MDPSDPGKPPFLLLPADLETTPAIPLHTGTSRLLNHKDWCFHDGASAPFQAEVMVSLTARVEVRCLAGSLQVWRPTSLLAEVLHPGQRTPLLPYDRIWVMQPANSLVLVPTHPCALLPDCQLVAELCRRGPSEYRETARVLLQICHRFTDPHLPVDLLLRVLTFTPFVQSSQTMPFSIDFTHLRTGITSLQTLRSPEVGVYLSLYPSGHVAFFAHHPCPMPDVRLRILHKPSGYPVLEATLQDLPIDVTTYGFPVLIKKDLLESLAPDEGDHVGLEVVYGPRRSPLLARALHAAVRFTDEVLAQAVSKSCAAPLQRARFLLQTASAFPEGAEPEVGCSLWSALKYIVREEGVRGLWRGNVLCVMRDLSARACHALLEARLGLEGRCSAHNTLSFAAVPTYVLRLLLRGLSCSLSPALSNFLLYPLEFLRTLMAADIGSSPLRGNAILRYATQGRPTRLYAGLLAGSACLLVHRLTFMLLQDEACRRPHPIRRRRLLIQLMSFTAALMAYPLDTIKRTQMACAAFEGRPLSAWACLTRIVARHGAGALWHGFGGNLLRSWLTALVLVLLDLLRPPPVKQLQAMWGRLCFNSVALGALLLLN